SMLPRRRLADPLEQIAITPIHAGLPRDFKEAYGARVAFSRNPANKTIVLRSLAKNLRLDNPDRLENTYRRVDDLPRKPCPSLPGVASVLKLLVQHGLNPKAAQLKPEDIADMSLCKKLDETGFMDRLYQGS
ncbi:MAG: NMT1 domain-containing protein, partial [Deltaproteobacteria bacterium]|nr:NMT1 domain-containing protein [Deltaproteobacteria bacterium]